ncbi:hypothetical protein [Ferrimonas marina]|uniref:Uncharacterized protein n=1 Tax=Ferrimonas marina TaxID=299255 RepID=A0A1M5MXR7_9GAMM|nr:hypothetical protein [Ferrimonas marina]SHG82071.1 hypothetical protein SAMN02745129_0823 [Ferrimonas marina]
MSDRLKRWWLGLPAHERSPLKVLAAILAGIALMVLGVELGMALN